MNSTFHDDLFEAVVDQLTNETIRDNDSDPQWSFLFDQPDNDASLGGIWAVTAPGADWQEAEIAARSFLWATQDGAQKFDPDAPEIGHRGWRRLFVFSGPPLSPADTDGAQWSDARVDLKA